MSHDESNIERVWTDLVVRIRERGGESGAPGADVAGTAGEKNFDAVGLVARDMGINFEEVYRFTHAVAQDAIGAAQAVQVADLEALFEGIATFAFLGGWEHRKRGEG